MRDDRIQDPKLSVSMFDGCSRGTGVTSCWLCTFAGAYPIASPIVGEGRFVSCTHGEISDQMRISPRLFVHTRMQKTPAHNVQWTHPANLQPLFLAPEPVTLIVCWLCVRRVANGRLRGWCCFVVVGDDKTPRPSWTPPETSRGCAADGEHLEDCGGCLSLACG